ncbi:MAG: radical SAM protein [Candidatus Bathycorpusculaceae bacterium]
MLYDPVERHLAVGKLVTRVGPHGQERKYYRIRPARWYGGIITADCVGCGLLCKFCWVQDNIMFHPANVGRFYSPTEIANSLVALAKKHKLNLLRVSGGEPTLGKKHLLELLDALIGRDFSFILETNGILIAYDENYSASLSKYDFVHVRVSLKGCNEEEFAMLTGARPEGFKFQLKALQKLTEAGVSCHPSVMASFSPKKNLQELTQSLKQINSSLVEGLEIEELILYPHVTRRIGLHKLKYYTAYQPDDVPPERI